jgi:hypothetical protein
LFKTRTNFAQLQRTKPLDTPTSSAKSTENARITTSFGSFDQKNTAKSGPQVWLLPKTVFILVDSFPENQKTIRFSTFPLRTARKYHWFQVDSFKKPEFLPRNRKESLTNS